MTDGIRTRSTTVDHLIESCLEKEPSRRPQSADDLLVALDDAASQPVSNARWRSRRMTLAISAVVLIAVASGAAAYSAYRARRAVSTKGTTNGAAFDLYVIGKEQLRRRASGVAESIQTFQRAIDLDSNFARAHAALATALALGSFFIDGPPAKLTERSITEARRALTLDSTLADAYAALGAAHAQVGEWEQSYSEMRHAIDLEPDSSSPRHTLARHLILRGHAAEAIEELERARKLDQTSPVISAWLAYAFFLEGRRDSALAESERETQLAPTFSASANLGALLNLGLGRNEEARRLMGMMVGPAMTNAPYVYAKLGDTARANRLVREMDARNPRPWWVDVAKAGVFLATGDTASALTTLERSSRDTGALWVFYIPVGDPAFDPVRKSARFAALLRQAHIDSGVITNPRRALETARTDR